MPRILMTQEVLRFEQWFPLFSRREKRMLTTWFGPFTHDTPESIVRSDGSSEIVTKRVLTGKTVPDWAMESWGKVTQKQFEELPNSDEIPGQRDQGVPDFRERDGIAGRDYTDTGP